MILKVGDGPSATSYKDGDIVRAFSMYEIYSCHAAHKCHINNFGLTTDGMRSPDPLLIKYLEKTNTYKFERLNSNDVKRTNLITGQEDIFNKTPNSNGERINVYQYVTRRIKNKNHRIFRSNGLEYWYGKVRSDIDIDAVWNDIETHTDFLQSDHIHFPLTEHEKRIFFPINSCMHVCEEGDDHDDAHCLSCICHCDLSECNGVFITERVSGIETIHNEGTEDQYNETIHRRKFQVPYWDFSSSLSINVDNVRNVNLEIDSRKELDNRPSAEVLTVDKTEAGIV